MKIKIKTKSSPAKPRRPPEISVRPNLAARPICAGPSPQAAPDPNGKTADRPPPTERSPPAQRPWPPNRIEKKNQEQAKTSQNKPNDPAAPPRGAAILGQTKTKRFGANRKRGPEAPDFGIIAHAPKPPNPVTPSARRAAPRGGGGEKKPPEEQANAASRRPLGGGSNRLQPFSPFPLSRPIFAVFLSSHYAEPEPKADRPGRTVDSSQRMPRGRSSAQTRRGGSKAGAARQATAFAAKPEQEKGREKGRRKTGRGRKKRREKGRNKKNRRLSRRFFWRRRIKPGGEDQGRAFKTRRLSRSIAPANRAKPNSWPATPQFCRWIAKGS